MRIGIDVLGSEVAPDTLFLAAIQAAKEMPDINFAVFSDSPFSEEIPNNLTVISECESIKMEDEPLSAVRIKKNASLVQGMKSLKEDRLDAFVSAGNTGALIAGSRLYLDLLPAVERPALLALMPSKTGAFALVDVGGNVSVEPKHLVQFAHFGAAYQRCVSSIASPRIGLLNIGVESGKGTTQIQQVFQLLSDESQNHPFIFVGNVEGREVFEGDVDVLVTDGFTGNVFLKTAEGISSLILDQARQSLSEEDLLEIRRHYNYAEYPGAVVCGIDKVVIKCHGAASTLAMLNSIRGAATLLRQKFLEKIKQEFSRSFP